MTLLRLAPLGDGGDGGDTHSRDSSHVDAPLESLEKTSSVSPRHHRWREASVEAFFGQLEVAEHALGRGSGSRIVSWRSSGAWRVFL